MNAPLSMSNNNTNSNASLYNQSNLQFSSSSSSTIGKLPLSLSQNQLLPDNLNSWNRNLNVTNSNNNQLNMIMQKNASSHSQNNYQLNHQISQQPATCSLNNTLFVGNLHASLQEIDLIQVFRPFGNIVECCKKWLHFGFVKFITEEEACHAYVTLNGFRLKGRPMRLEFQNRTKKARIKALIAQATLQSSNPNSNNFPLTNDGYNLLNFQVNDERQNQNYQNQYHHHQQNSGQINSSFKQQNSLLECLNKKMDENNMFDSTNNFFNADQLIKFANSVDLDLQNKQQTIQIPQFEFNFDFTENIENKDKSKNDETLLNLVKKTISPIDSPQHDLSSSSDSGCRSVSFIADCDDSAINTITSNSICSSNKSKCLKSNEQFLSVEKSLIRKQVNDEFSLSEHLEFTCSNSITNTNNFDNENLKEPSLKNKQSQIEKQVDNDDCDDDTDSDCDTSDDASELPLDSDCLNDLDLIEYNDLTNYDSDEINRYIQVVDEDGSIAKKKLHYGCIYRSINQTMSLFIEPNDILKLMNADEYNEYILFPNEDAENIKFDDLDCDSKNGIVNHSSNSELIESIELVIKNHYYL